MPSSAAIYSFHLNKHYIQNIISVKYEFDSKNKFIRDSDKLEGIKEICTTKIKNIIETQLTELYKAKILK